jgi:glycosyltransferase involved in cell wall biosynthesis
MSLPVTPVILTYNEEPNLRRALESLFWAERVIVLDSGSTDATEAIAKSFSNVDWHIRPFDSHRAQWTHGICATGITSEFVLALDADMSVPQEFVEEMSLSIKEQKYQGGITPFEFRILGRTLAGSIYPAQLRLFKPEMVRIRQAGHTQEFSTSGPIYRFKTPLIHDDRKSLERWVLAQLSYSSLEANRINAGSAMRWRDWVRTLGLMPVIAGVLAYLRAGGPLKGAAAVRYAYERAGYECLLAIRLMSSRLQKGD